MACGDAADRRPGPSARFSRFLFVRGRLLVYPRLIRAAWTGAKKPKKMLDLQRRSVPNRAPMRRLNQPKSLQRCT